MYYTLEPKSLLLIYITSFAGGLFIRAWRVDTCFYGRLQWKTLFTQWHNLSIKQCRLKKLFKEQQLSEKNATIDSFKSVWGFWQSKRGITVSNSKTTRRYNRVTVLCDIRQEIEIRWLQKKVHHFDEGLHFDLKLFIFFFSNGKMYFKLDQVVAWLSLYPTTLWDRKVFLEL